MAYVNNGLTEVKGKLFMSVRMKNKAVLFKIIKVAFGVFELDNTYDFYASPSI